MKNKVLVVVDMQNDFVTGSLGTDEAKPIVPNVVKWVKRQRKTETQLSSRRIHMNKII